MNVNSEKKNKKNSGFAINIKIYKTIFVVSFFFFFGLFSLIAVYGRTIDRVMKNGEKCNKKLFLLL